MSGDRQLELASFSGVVLGVCLALLVPCAHVVLIIRVVRAGSLPWPLIISLLFIGVSQIVYILPAIWLARRHSRFGVAKGLAVGAGALLVVNVLLGVDLLITWAGKAL